ncbi:MAG: iron-containing alcohol dehydrogenase [Cellvibrionaceae bacterium]
MKNFNFNSAKSIRFGKGMLSNIGEIVKNEIGDHVMLVTDPGMISTGIIDRALDILYEANVEVELYKDTLADPPEAIVLEAVEQAKNSNVKGVVGIGGGSSLDVAKLIALLALGDKSLIESYGVNNAKGTRLPLLLVPTTAGTGSEVTPISIVTTGVNKKAGIISPVLLPDIALLDPELTLGLPSYITAATGIDAIVHAIEAYASVNVNNNLISKTMAEKAISLLVGSLETTVNEGDDIDARSNMLLGAMLAGQAFANSPVAAVHALAYPLGGRFHIPHGLSNALVLPHVLRFNIATTPEPYAELAPFAFPDLIELEGKERAISFCERLEGLSRACGLQQSLKEMNIPKAKLPQLAVDAMTQTRLLVNNPRDINEDDALKIYESAY